MAEIKIKTIEQGRKILKALKIYSKYKDDGFLIYFNNLTFIKHEDFLKWFNEEFKYIYELT